MLSDYDIVLRERNMNAAKIQELEKKLDAETKKRKSKVSALVAELKAAGLSEQAMRVQYAAVVDETKHYRQLIEKLDEAMADPQRIADDILQLGSFVSGLDLVETADQIVMKATDQLKALRAVTAAFIVTAEGAVRHHENKHKGGQQVGYHDDFASMPPSSVSRLKWWARVFREALEGRFE